MVDEISDSFSMVPLISLIALDRFLGRRLDAADLLADLAGGFRSLLGQRLHFGRHDRKTRGRLRRRVPPRWWRSGRAGWSVPRLC